MISITEKLNSPGSHALIYPGIVGDLEVELSVPSHPISNALAMIGHPHPLFGGTMNNKVVSTLVRVFDALNIPSLRFNFRGVGKSEGGYDAGLGESEDMLLLVKQWLIERPETRVFFAGFSFGSYVAWRAAVQSKAALLISIAPPVHHYDYTEFPPAPHPWIVVQGDQDEVVPANLVCDFVKRYPTIELLRFANASHFFHGELIALKEQLIHAIQAYELT
jgi:alpha/beta superfamily hydrolase